MHPKSAQEKNLKRTNIVLALPSYDRQRLSNIRRGWCPSQSNKTERVVRSDASEAHRLSLSARVLSAHHRQVKAKTAAAEALLMHFETRSKRRMTITRIAMPGDSRRTLQHSNCISSRVSTRLTGTWRGLLAGI
jgi:hypothetical protein